MQDTLTASMRVFQTLPRRVWLLALAAVLLTTLPYLIGIFAAPPGSVFSGGLIDISDYNSHLSKMQQGMRGTWRYQQLFTNEPHDGAYLQTFYIALGHVVRWTGLPLPLVYHAARVLFTILMVIVLWLFMKRFLSDESAWWALFLSILGGGFGLLLYLIAPEQVKQISPIELWLIDAYVLFSVFVFPHFAAAIALLALIFLNADRWAREQASGALAWVVVGSLILGILAPFDLLTVLIVVAVMAAARVVMRQLPIPRAITGLALLSAGVLALVGYDWIVLKQDAVFRSFVAQDVMLSPPPIYFLLGFAPVLIPAILGLVRAVQQREERLLAPGVWLLCISVLVYLPITTNRRFVLAAQVPMALMATYWLAAVALPWARRRSPRHHRQWVLIYLSAATFSTWFVFFWWVGLAGQPANKYSLDNVAAWGWIRQNTDANAIFLAGSEMSGGALAANAGRHVVLGHWSETMDYDRKVIDVKTFYQPGTAADWQRHFIDSEHVDYIFYGPDERAASTWTPLPNMQIIYQSGATFIYKVLH